MISCHRVAKIFAVWLVCAITSRLIIPRNAHKSILNSSTSTQPDAQPQQVDDDEYFTLCNKKLYLKDMPYAKPGSDAPYGVREWKQHHDIKNAIVLQHDEGSQIYGRTGNHIQEFFHAFDMARDKGGAVVLHETGFPMDLVLKDIFLGTNNKTILEEKFGIMFYNSIAIEQRSNIQSIPTDQLYHFISKDERFVMDNIIQHRHYVIQQLYRITAVDMKRNPNSAGATAMCSSLHAFFGKDGRSANSMVKELGIKDVTSKYTVIHARTLEGFGDKFMAKAHEVFGVDPRVGKEYPANLISAILTPLGMQNNSILMITDGKNPNVVNQLANDPTIGPFFQVVPKTISTVTGDMMLAILSEVFIGNPCSTFSQYIAQVRYALGIGNSYIFSRRNGDKWETFCSSDEACFYTWQQMWIPLF